MTKYVALTAVVLALGLFAGQAEARHGRGCPGGVCATGGGPWLGAYPVGPVYGAAPMKAAVVDPTAPAVVAGEAPANVAPQVAQPVRYYTTNTGRFGWRRLAR